MTMRKRRALERVARALRQEATILRGAPSLRVVTPIEAERSPRTETAAA